MYACWKGEKDIVQRLIRSGASLTTTDKRGNTPLIWAVKCKGCLEVVGYLLDNGADVSWRNSEGETALVDSAVYRANSQIIKTLVRKGAEIDAFDKAGNTALINAACSGNADNVEMLLNLGANTSLMNKRGYNAAFAAGLSGDIQTMLLLGWKDTISEVAAVITAPILAGLLVYPLQRKKDKSKQRRRLLLKKLFWAQIVLDSFFGLVVLVTRRTGLYFVPTIDVPLFWGCIGILGALFSIIAIWWTRPLNQPSAPVSNRVG